MVHTSIESVDATGRVVPADPELKGRVERAAALLETRLTPLTRFDIEHRWRIVHQPGSAPRVELELTTDGRGIRDWVFDTKNWGSDDGILPSLHAPIWAFADVLSAVQSERMERNRQRFEALMSVGEE